VKIINKSVKDGWVDLFLSCVCVFGLSFLEESWKNKKKAQICWVGGVFVCLLFIGFFVGGKAFKKKRKKENSHLSKSEGHITP
jgi:arginine exporter protein ArgO